uniref:Protein kinase domain-containing protein n=1 Tax=Physcomitrium patens TaxID=3218 RepID=A0A2K1LAW0_PHYPA|nr:hypothetical protein PHYPA_001597 [Physcomitrium patens]
MKTSLSKLVKESGELSYIFLIDVMHQIVRRMYYLHDMYIVHHDLKLDNIFLNIKKKRISNENFQHVIVKVINFGISKIEVGSNPKASIDKKVYGTPKYIAPKALKNKSQIMTMCHFEADVYSFVMLYCKMLSKKIHLMVPLRQQRY